MYGYIEVSMGADLKFVNEEYNSINKQSTVQAINQFLKFYNISEDELSPDSIYRDFFRNKKNDKNSEHHNKKTAKAM